MQIDVLLYFKLFWISYDLTSSTPFGFPHYTRIFSFMYCVKFIEILKYLLEIYMIAFDVNLALVI